MNKFILFLVAITIVVSLSGCSNLSNNQDSDIKVEKTPENSLRADLEEKKVEIEATPTAKSAEKKTITLYFSDSRAEFVVAEKREVEFEQGKRIEEIVINELINGPQSENLDPTIPTGARLITAETKNGVCNLNLSKEFIENSFTGSAGETMTVYSIVNSLTELPGVDKVQFLIEGEKREVYMHMAFDTPIERNEKLIGKQ